MYRASHTQQQLSFQPRKATSEVTLTSLDEIISQTQTSDGFRMSISSALEREKQKNSPVLCFLKKAKSSEL